MTNSDLTKLTSQELLGVMVDAIAQDARHPNCKMNDDNFLTRCLDPDCPHNPWTDHIAEQRFHDAVEEISRRITVESYN